MEALLASRTAEKFHDLLDAEPEAWDLRLILADLLEDGGDPDGAAYQRWASRNKKRPKATNAIAGFPVYWFWWPSPDTSGDVYSHVPDRQWRLLVVPEESPLRRPYRNRSRQGAEDDYAAVLRHLGVL